MRALVLVLLGVGLASGGVLAGPVISASCDGCLQDGDILSVPVGRPVAFQVSDAQAAPAEAIWVFSDGSKRYGLAATYVFKTPGRYTVEVLAIYGTDVVPRSATLTVHVIAAPPVGNNQIFGLPTEIVYPILSALAVVIVYWLTGTVPGG